MKKKIDLALEFLQKNIEQFQCPICEADLKVFANEKSLKCSAGHTFDISKKGTVQLVNKFVQSDYDEKLFSSRSYMMNAGLFDPVFEALTRNIAENDLVIDAGSGEGSAMIYLREQKPLTAIGFDLASEGIQSSSRGLMLQDIFFSVANLANIPLKDNSVDTIVNLLSPASYDEFKRILKPGKNILKVVPNTNYLTEIRQFVAQRQEHINSTYDNSEVIENLMKNNKTVEVEDINYQFKLDTPELKENMYQMTPLTWSLDDEVKQEFIESNIDNITVNLQLLKISE
ncbi:50S rRNA methyltransferase [Companilactobacillus sp. RD055328]|uniref:putative RNA methyltransferase n=1 Tax=Companilactobacillus sp. RD055328 TaxID=2916634 RepID=UPI001FC8224B|nr:methyltransferase domain-containing protein [Companilactobacillus sp. RD055328]GKQ43075.1 50S rRNA methyltransferase [Companilactobacillus sp. RD055328]